MNTNETKTPAPLTAAEIEARKAIMAAADTAAKAEMAKPADMPQNTPSKPADTVSGPAPTPTAANPEKPPVDAGKALAGMLAAKQGDAPKVLPDLTAKPQGGKPTTHNPHTAPVKPQQAKQGGTAGGKATGKPENQVKPVTAAKPEKAKPETKATPGTVAGYDLSKWPQWLETCKPALADILAVRAMNIKRPNTSHELALAAYIRLGGKLGMSTVDLAKLVNVFDVGQGIARVRNTKPDNKQNVALDAARDGWVTLIKVGGVPSHNPDRTADERKVSYRCGVAGIKAEKRKVIYAYLEANGCKVPAYMLPADTAAKPAQPGK